MSPVAAPVRVMMALVATVAPWVKDRTAEAATPFSARDSATPLPDGGIEVRRRGEDLLRHRPAPGEHQHDVGEGAADVHSNPEFTF